MLSGPVTSDKIDQKSTAPLSDQDHAILGRVGKTLARGLALKRWWERMEATGGYLERYELAREFNQSDTSFGFFDQVSLDGRIVPVMGSVEDSLYDQPKHASGDEVRDEFREFVLRYFMRISDYRPPEAYTEGDCAAPSNYLRGLSWCPEREVNQIGFGFSQHYYKLCDSGLVGKFHQRDGTAIVDLREIGKKYEWIVVKVRIFNFNLTFRLIGSNKAKLVIPLREETYLVLSRDFILNEDNPKQSVLGRYGFGYAFIRNLTDELFAYGPGQFDTAIELINFSVLESGETRARLVFVANRPERILNVSINPVDWSFWLADLMSLGLTSTLFAPVRSVLNRLPLRMNGFDPISAYVSLANQLTGGLAAEELCISREQLEKDFLTQHFMQHYQMLTGSLLTWRRIRNWLDTAALPEWVIKGMTS